LNTFQKLPRLGLIEGRMQFVINQCRGQRVLHIGCVDTGVLRERFERGELLHQKLNAVARDLWGSDINEDGLRFLKDRGYTQLALADASFIGENPDLQTQIFDIIVATELMEHLSNPGMFLDSLKQLMEPDQTHLIVSVPNAFRLRSLVYLLRRIEYVHPDHNYWYSSYTIMNLLKKHGYQVIETHMYMAGKMSLTSFNSLRTNLLHPLNLIGQIVRIPVTFLTRLFLRLFPYFADGVIVIAIFPDTR
jgi:2-polyprenyl-3-methyl-5-hydroxy-6-metoxy-1,4-benzoquinol methylase